MNPLSEKDIRASFVNASKRERTEAPLPDLTAQKWAELDLLGWKDPIRPQVSYLVVQVQDEAVGIFLRRPDNSGGQRRAGVCVLCEDVSETQEVLLHTARRAGASGRKGNTIGTLICADLQCSRRVRRVPTVTEIGTDDEAEVQWFIDQRIEGLRERSARFARSVLEG
ncbi:FBP domain-containing protein [Dermacoccaceae bacterium W4C1]